MEITNHGHKIYNREEIVKLVQDWYGKHGKIVIRDMRHKNGLPSTDQITRTFGTFQNCLREAGIPVDDKEHLFKREYLSDEEMLSNYKQFVEEHLKTHIFLPTNNEVDTCNYIQSTGSYINRFGSFENVNYLIGYDQYEFNKNALEKDMLFKYKRACKDNGRSLNSREITKLSKANKDYIYSTEAYTTHFGSIHNLQETCGFDKTVPGKGASKEEMLDKLKWLGETLGRRPVQGDLKLYKNVPSSNAYLDVFGSFKTALNKAGFEKQRVLKTKNGVKCRSTFELQFANMLEKYNIEYENEVPYVHVIRNFKKKYRFDFVVNIDERKFYIELFGIIGNEKYEKRKQEKINICKVNNVPLIELYQSDIYSKSNKEMYENLLNYIAKLVKKTA